MPNKSKQDTTLIPIVKPSSLNQSTTNSSEDKLEDDVFKLDLLNSVKETNHVKNDRLAHQNYEEDFAELDFDEEDEFEEEFDDEEEFEEDEETRRYNLIVKKKNKRLNRIAIFLAILILIYGLALLSLYYCQINKIDVKGCNRTNKTQIQELIRNNNTLLGTNINNVFYTCFLFNTNKIDLPEYLNSIKIKINSTNTITAYVKEKSVLGYIENNSKYLVIARGGIVLEELKTPPQDLTLLQLSTSKKYKLYDKLDLSSNNIEGIEDIISVAKKNKYMLSVINLENTNNIYFMIEDNKIIVGTTNYIYDKMAKIKPISMSVDLKTGVLHLENYTPENELITFDNY